MRTKYLTFLALILILSITTYPACGRRGLRKVGKLAPDFEYIDLRGHVGHLYDFRGKVVLLRFWADWCDYCWKEMPVLEEFYSKNKDRGFVVIGANVGQARDVAEAFVEKNGLTYPIFIDPEGKLAKSYGVYGIPTNFIINQEGVIMDIILGGGFVELNSSRRILFPYIEGTAKPQKG